MSHPNTSNSPQATLEGAFTLQRRDFVLSVGSLALTGCGGGGAGGGAAGNSPPPVAPPATPTVWVVQTVAGQGGRKGSANGMGTAATFTGPGGLCVDKAGNVYVADVDFDLVNNVPITSRIRKISPTGVVTTLAGGDHEGSADGVGTLATFAGASSVAVDSQGDVFVADAGNQLIRKIAPDGTVSTLAGQGSGSSQILDGTGRSASFSYLLHGLTVDASDNLYVRDARYVRKITPSGVVSTLSGTAMAGTPSATTTWLTFNQNYGVAVDKSNNVYVFEQVAPRIRKISPEGVLSTLAGSGTIGTADGTGTGASFFNPWGLDIDSSGVLYVADGNGLGNMAGDPNVFNGVRRVSPDGVVTTIAGPLYGAGGSADGTGSHATFNSPIDVAVDASGNLWVSDAGNYLIRKIIHIP